MSEKTPVERATRALARMNAITAWDAAKVALTAAVEDREGLARVLIDHTRLSGILGDCSCGIRVPLGHSFAEHQADAVARWLTGSES